MLDVKCQGNGSLSADPDGAVLQSSSSGIFSCATHNEASHMDPELAKIGRILHFATTEFQRSP